MGDFWRNFRLMADYKGRANPTPIPPAESWRGLNRLAYNATQKTDEVIIGGLKRVSQGNNGFAKTIQRFLNHFGPGLHTQFGGLRRLIWSVPGMSALTDMVFSLPKIVRAFRHGKQQGGGGLSGLVRGLFNAGKEVVKTFASTLGGLAGLATANGLFGMVLGATAATATGGLGFLLMAGSFLAGAAGYGIGSLLVRNLVGGNKYGAEQKPTTEIMERVLLDRSEHHRTERVEITTSPTHGNHRTSPQREPNPFLQ